MERQRLSWNFVTGILIGFLAAGLLGLIVSILPGQDGLRLSPAPTSEPISVQLKGEVLQPGVYTLPPGSRVVDLLQLSGGLSPDAMPNSLNLARPLLDGELIVIPSNLDVDTKISTPLININRASAEELVMLPDIGPVLAKEIVNYRERHGPFEDLEDLLDVPGIGEVTLNKIKLLVVFIDP